MEAEIQHLTKNNMIEFWLAWNLVYTFTRAQLYQHYIPEKSRFSDTKFFFLCLR